jgi:hypothetical protein
MKETELGKHSKEPKAVRALIKKAKAKQATKDARNSDLGSHMIRMMRAAVTVTRRKQGKEI